MEFDIMIGNIWFTSVRNWRVWKPLQVGQQYGFTDEKGWTYEGPTSAVQIIRRRPT